MFMAALHSLCRQTVVNMYRLWMKASNTSYWPCAGEASLMFQPLEKRELLGRLWWVYEAEGMTSLAPEIGSPCPPQSEAPDFQHPIHVSCMLYRLLSSFSAPPPTSGSPTFFSLTRLIALYCSHCNKSQGCPGLPGALTNLCLDNPWRKEGALTFLLSLLRGSPHHLCHSFFPKQKQRQSN